MDYKKVIPMITNILEECDGGEDPRICDKCAYSDICMGLFLGGLEITVPTMDEERK